MVTQMSLECYCSSLLGLFLLHLSCGREWGANSILGRFMVRRSTFEFTICRPLQSYFSEKYYHLSIKYFFMVLSKPSNPIPFLSTNFVWKSKAPSKVKAFAWLVVHKKVNTNDMLQVRRPYKSLSSHWCLLCRESG